LDVGDGREKVVDGRDGRLGSWFGCLIQQPITRLVLADRVARQFETCIAFETCNSKTGNHPPNERAQVVRFMNSCRLASRLSFFAGTGFEK
jgi:hypothetical protein